jgi:CubicO group peptidase (beta-lactamase class C family)
MSKTLKRGVAAVMAMALAAGPVLGQAAKPEADANAGQAEALRLADLWLDGVQAYDHVPTISVGVVKGDKLVWAKGYGTIDRDHKVPASPTTIYSICSISKLFTSVALMQQWEQGKVRLDEPISTYLPWAKLKPTDEDSVPITLRAILSHSAGLPRESDYPYWTGPDFPFPTEAQIKSRFPEQSPLFPASRWFQYSNLGLTLVGETVQAVSGEPYADYARTHVIEPLGLKDTRTFMPMQLYGTQLAVGWGAIKRDGSRDPVAPFKTNGVTPAAGYTSTVEDLAKFAEWQFRLLRTGKPELLKASTLREMQRVQFTDPDWKTTWGLGFTVGQRGDKTYVGHGGDCPGYHTILQMRPEDETAVVAMSTGAERPGAWASAVFALLDKRKVFAFKEPAPATGVVLSDYAGRYSNQPWGSEFLITPWAGGLAELGLPSRDPAAELAFYKPKGGDVFRRVRADGSEAEEIRFERGPDGKVVRLVHFSNVSGRVGELPAE